MIRKSINLIIMLQLLIPFHLSADYRVNSGTFINWQKGYISSKEKASIAIEEKGVPVDFNTGRIISINRARRDAYLQAKDRAIENIVMALRSIQVDPERTLEDLIEKEIYTQKRLPEKMLDSLVVKEFPANFYSSACEIRLRFGDILAAIPYDFPAHDFPRRNDIPISTFYSSLIVDSRGLNIKPMLLPSVYNEDGLEIYGRYHIDSAFISNGGMVSYCHTEDEALMDTKAGDNPYFTIALKSIRGCPVLSEKDTRRILSNPGTINNLKKCRVIFILDRKR